MFLIGSRHSTISGREAPKRPPRLRGNRQITWWVPRRGEMSRTTPAPLPCQKAGPLTLWEERCSVVLEDFLIVGPRCSNVSDRGRGDTHPFCLCSQRSGTKMSSSLDHNRQAAVSVRHFSFLHLSTPLSLFLYFSLSLFSLFLSLSPLFLSLAAISFWDNPCG